MLLSSARFQKLLDEFRENHGKFCDLHFWLDATTHIDHLTSVHEKALPIPLKGVEPGVVGFLSLPVLDPSGLLDSAFLDDPPLSSEEDLRSWAQKLLRKPRRLCMIYGPSTGEFEEAFESFKRLAERAGKELPLKVREMIPAEFDPYRFVDRWLEFLWWLSPPDARTLAMNNDSRLHGWTLFLHPFRESADGIERCELHTVNPAFRPKEWPVWAGNLPAITIASSETTEAQPEGSKLLTPVMSAPSGTEPIPWSRWDSPAEWAKALGMTEARAFIRRCKAGKIIHEKMDDKTYRIDLRQLPHPAQEQ